MHYLKTWPIYFNEICSGQKTFEVRKNDRNFKKGDSVTLQEYDPEAKMYTGREIIKTIGFILNNENPFLELNNTVIFSII